MRLEKRTRVQFPEPTLDSSQFPSGDSMLLGTPTNTGTHAHTHIHT